MAISSWLNFGRPASPGKGSAAGQKFLAPSYCSQRTVFASPLSAFSWNNYQMLAVSLDTVLCILLWYICRAPLSLILISIQVNQQITPGFFTGRMPFLSPNQQHQSTEGKISHSMDLLTPSSPEVFQLCLWPLIAPGYLRGGLPCLSSALWCQYPTRKFLNLMKCKFKILFSKLL